MASTSLEDESESEIGIDSSLMNQLLYSLGRLKFSIRTLGTLNSQMAIHQNEETEVDPDSEFIESLESNRILENIMLEFSKRKTSSDKISKDLTVNGGCSKDMSPLEDLQIIYEKLNCELSKIRSHYQSAFSEKAEKTGQLL